MPVIDVYGQRLSFPDDMSESQIQSAIENEYLPTIDPESLAGRQYRADLQMQQAQQLAESRRLATEVEPSQVEAGIRGFAQGTTFGLGEEIGAAVTAAAQREGTFSERYKRIRDEQRAQNRLARERYPVTYTGAELGGGLATGVSGAGRAVAGQTFRQAIPRLSAIGAAEGGLAGFGLTEAETAPGIAMDVAKGAGAGAVLAPVIGGTVAGLSRVGREIVRPFRAEARAARQLTRDMSADDLIIADAEQRLAANPNLILADLGENLQQRLGSIAQRPGPTAQAAREFLEDRNIAQLERLTPRFEEALGSKGVLAAAKESNQRGKNAADELYKIAYAKPIRGTVALQRLAERDAYKSADREARKFMRDKGVDPDSGANNTELMDQIQRRLFDKENAFAKAGKRERANDIKQLRKSVAAEVNKQVPELGQAKSIWRGEFANQEAMDLGSSIFRQKTPNLREAVQEMSESERSHLRIGVFDAVIDRLGTKVETANLIQDFRKPKIREAMRIAFDNPRLFSEFEQIIGDEKRMFETMAKALQGSPTASRLAFTPGAETLGAAIGDIAIGPGAGSVAAQAGRGLLSRAGQALGGAAQQRQADIVGQALLSRTPQQTLQMLRNPPRTPAQLGALTQGTTVPLLEQLVPRDVGPSR